MGKIKRLFKKKSIKTSFMLYTLACILTALLAALLLSGLCQFGQSQIHKKYRIEYGSLNELATDERAVMDKNGQLIYYPVDISSHFTSFEKMAYDILGFFSIAVYPICFVTGIGITSLLFYKKQIQKPLEILDDAADKIADNNLDFEIVYHKPDEFGKLCRSFDKMRTALQDNQMEMWRQMEERRRLNAAFSHDLRTPLTVLKGQSDMLKKYAPQMTTDKVAATADMMGRHILRLEDYVNTMNDLQRLEDIDMDKQPVHINDILNQFTATGQAVCKDKTFRFSDTANNGGDTMTLDVAVVMRVYENLLANAVRFAKDTITVAAAADMNNGCFYITVSDDGKGFSDKDLREATKPFYKAGTDNDHFGLGLNICKILCEKHGGSLELSNHDGATVTAAFHA